MELNIFPAGRQLFMATRTLIRLIFFAAFLLTMGAFPLAGQGNQPSKPISQAERERLFKAGLKLDPPPIGAIELELRQLIPSDEEMEAKEIHLRSVHNFSVDDRGHIFLPEYTFTAIYEFDAEGRLLHKFDKKGRGPGELTYPNQVWFFNGQIVVYDGGPMRINFYDRDWRFARSFQNYKHQFKFIAGKNNLIYAVNLRDDYLIDIIDSSGKGLDSFGALPSKKGSLLNRAILGISPDGSVWVGLESIAKLKKYSPQGILQKEIDLLLLLSRKLKDHYKQNMDWDKKGEQKHYLLLQAMSFFGNDLLVQAGGLIHPIYRFNSAGTIVKTYYIRPGRHYIAYDGLCARMGKNGEEEFLILKKDYEEGDVRIGVYSPKLAKQ